MKNSFKDNHPIFEPEIERDRLVQVVQSRNERSMCHTNV